MLCSLSSLIFLTFQYSFYTCRCLLLDTYTYISSMFISCSSFLFSSPLIYFLSQSSYPHLLLFLSSSDLSSFTILSSSHLFSFPIHSSFPPPNLSLLSLPFLPLIPFPVLIPSSHILSSSLPLIFSPPTLLSLPISNPPLPSPSQPSSFYTCRELVILIYILS